jgi:hypothetical protein
MELEKQRIPAIGAAGLIGNTPASKLNLLGMA